MVLKITHLWKMKGTGEHWPSTSWSPTTARSDMTLSQETNLTLCLAVSAWQVHLGIQQHQESRSFVSIEHLTSYATWTAMNSCSLHLLMTSQLVRAFQVMKPLFSNKDHHNDPSIPPSGHGGGGAYGVRVFWEMVVGWRVDVFWFVHLNLRMWTRRI